MSITKMNLFVRSLVGRFITLVLTLLIFNLHSCTVYHAADITSNELVSNQQVSQNMDIYQFFVHDAFQTYKVIEPSFDNSGAIFGRLVPVKYEKPDSTWSKSKKRDYWKDHKYDINIYCKAETTLSQLQANQSETTIVRSDQETAIAPEMMSRITITSVDREKQIAGAALAVLIIVGVVVGTFLIVLLTTVLAKASSDEANTSSDESSGNSGSDSGSDGSSDGSNSGSGGSSGG